MTTSINFKINPLKPNKLNRKIIFAHARENLQLFIRKLNLDLFN